MLDKSIKYYSVLMIREGTEESIEKKLPKGFKIVSYKPGMEEAWAEVETAVGEFSQVIDAQRKFQSEFINSGRDLIKHCYFVKDEKGEIVATASIWQGAHISEDEKYRLHWVAVKPESQGKGIATALISHILNLDFIKGQDVYLTTQTWSYRAINIYRKLGFIPYEGLRPNPWSCEEDEFEQYNQNAWNLIFSKIG